MSHAPNDDAPMGDDLPDDLAAAPEPDSSGSRSVGRRPFMKGAMVGAGSLAAGGFSLRYGTREAEALAVTTAVGIAVGGAAVGYLINEAADKYLGDERDYSNYTGGEALKTEVAAGFTEMKSADERVMTSISNNITNSENVALAKGKAAIIEKMNAGASESEAETAMLEAIDGYYTTIQKNILTHYETQLAQVSHHFDALDNHADTNPGDVLELYHSGSAVLGWRGMTNPKSEITTNVTLLDGSTYTFTGFSAQESAYDEDFEFSWPPAHKYVTEVTLSGQNMVRYLTDPASNTYTEWGIIRFKEAYDAVSTSRDNVNAALSGFVTDVYNNWEPGEIPTEDLVDPITASTELAQNYDGYQAQGAHAAMLGIPTTAEQSVNLTVHTADGDRNIWADIYTEYVPTDGSGNEIGFESGTTYDPSTWDKPLYIAYEYTEETQDGTTTETDFVQLEDSFTIDAIEDKDGNEVDSFQTTSRNNQTADVSTLQEELDQLREAQLEMQEEAQSGGGGFIDNLGFGGIPGEGVLVGIIGIIVVLLGQSD